MKDKVITLTDLLARKEQSDKDKMKGATIYSKELGGNIPVVKLPTSSILEKMDQVDETSNMRDNMEWNIEIIYAHVPMLKSQELQEAYECEEPTDIVEKVFDGNIGAIGRFASELLSLYGLGKDYDLEQEVKN